MLSVFRHASASILAVFGQDAFLRGEPTPYRINIEHGVDVVNGEQEIIIKRSVATIPREAGAKIGDALVHPDGEFVLDNIYQDNGVNKRFVLRPKSTV